MVLLSFSKLFIARFTGSGFISIVFSLLIFKAIIITLIYVFFENINEDLFRFADFEDYSDRNAKLPYPNFGFAMITQILQIYSTSDAQSILAALILVFFRDLVIAYVLYRKFSFRTSFLFVILIGFHPYVAIYSVKFTSDIFTSLAILTIFAQIYFQKFKLIYFLPLSLTLMLCRNFTTFIFSTFYLSKIIAVSNLKNKIGFLFLAVITLIFGLYISGQYVTAQTVAFAYVGPLDGILGISTIGNNLLSNDHTYFLIQVLSRIILLFGGREKYYVEGIDSIMDDNILILICSVCLLPIHIFSFILFIRAAHRYFGVQGLSVIFPLILTIFTVAHLRYLGPYIPFMMASLAIFINGLFARQVN